MARTHRAAAAGARIEAGAKPDRRTSDAGPDRRDTTRCGPRPTLLSRLAAALVA